LPGLFGLLNYNKGEMKNSLMKMAEGMSYSGLGHTDIWCDEDYGIGLGHNSLDIFIKEVQPVRLNSGVRMFVHGEIVDADDLRKNLLIKGFNASNVGKASLVLMQYLIEGIDAFPEINGSVAVAIWDQDNRKLTLVPDRFSLRPLYYSEINGIFAFASEIKSLLTLDFVPKNIDEEAILEFFAFEQLRNEQTFTKSIKKIPFGSVLTYCQEKVQIEERWPLLYHQPEPKLSEREYLEKFICLGKRAVKKRLNNNQTIIGLSGGLDSRLLMALALEEKLHINTCTFGQKNSKDLVRGMKLANATGADHISLILEKDYLQKYADQMVDRVGGLFSVLNCHGMIFTEIASQYPIVAMANGLDQLLWSTRSHYRSSFDQNKSIAEAFFEYENEGLMVKENWEKWYTEKWYKQHAASVYEKFILDMERFQLDSIDNSIDSFKLQLNMGYVGASLPMITHQMEFSEPFFDTDLMEFILSVPLNLRWNRKLVKMAIEYLSPQLAQIDGGPLEKESQWEKYSRKALKFGEKSLLRIGYYRPIDIKPPSSTFTNMHQLLRLKNYSLWMEQTLLQSQTLVGEIIKPEILKQLVNEHINGVKNHTSKLGVLMTVELNLRNISGIQPQIVIEKQQLLSNRKFLFES